MTNQVFISYCHGHSDQDVAREVCRIVELAGISAWLDQRRLAAGQRFNSEIANAIGKSRGLMLVASAASLASPYVQAEVLHAFTLEAQGRRSPVAPLWIEPVSALPPELFRLGAIHRVDLYEIPRESWSVPIHNVLASWGFPVEVEDTAISLTYPGVRSFDWLQSATQPALQAYLQQISSIAAGSPAAGFAKINLALVQLHLGDTVQAQLWLDRALEAAPADGRAQYYWALARCARCRIGALSISIIQSVLQRLKTARMISPNFGCIDFLEAVIAREKYVAHGMTPPQDPVHLLERFASSEIDADETLRLLDVIQVMDVELKGVFASLRERLERYRPRGM